MLACAQLANAATMDVSSSTAGGGSRGQVGLMLEQGKLSVDSSLIVNTDRGNKDVARPALGWTPFDSRKASSLLRTPRLQNDTGTYRLQSATRLLYAVDGQVVDHIEGNIRRSRDGTGETRLAFGFQELQTGVALFGGAPLGVETGLTFEQTDGDMRARSTVSSSFGLGHAVDVRSSVRWVDDGTGSAASTLNAQLVYRASLRFVKRVVGRINRNASGKTRRTLSMYFPKIDRKRLGQTRLSVDTSATFSEVTPVMGNSDWRMGLKTTLSGVAPSLLGGQYSLSLQLEQEPGADGSYRSSLAYDHSWHPGRFSSVGLDVKLVDTSNDLEPALGIRWRATFE